MGGSGPTSPGVYLLAARDVFALNAGQYAKLGLTVNVSFFEIYAGKVRTAPGYVILQYGDAVTRGGLGV